MKIRNCSLHSRTTRDMSMFDGEFDGFLEADRIVNVPAVLRSVARVVQALDRRIAGIWPKIGPVW